MFESNFSSIFRFFSGSASKYSPDGIRYVKVETTFSPQEPEKKQYKTVVFDATPKGERVTKDLRWGFWDSESEARDGHDRIVKKLNVH